VIDFTILKLLKISEFNQIFKIHYNSFFAHPSNQNFIEILLRHHF